MSDIKISPSILSADFSCLYEQIREVEKGGANLLHIDVMDGHFVPSITIGPVVMRSIRQITQLGFCAHLMVSDPLLQVREFAEAGANIIAFHVESGPNVDDVIKAIRTHEKRVEITINPHTSFSEVTPYLADVDILLIMTVVPGQGGQELMREVIPKIREARAYREEHGLDYEIEVDGGVKIDNAAEIASAGADILVAGSEVFRHPVYNIIEAITALREAVAKN